ncbi:MMPL family transporter [Conexibacter sp. SYSU D00693]|uniref:MMPL family transporter n=1 Tax=Conexibacter sp. SYSU D00693 TaxID=2812560 RepID=UPI00196B3BF8|nr:MMPL family transporter [Conexibacter sp. SYSU D00693]
MLVRRLIAHPRRALLALLAFVLVAGVVGGPVADRLSSDGGFVAAGADSQVAVERVEAATGRAPHGGVVVLVDAPTPQRVAGVVDRLARLPGVASARDGGRLGDDAVATATLRADADDDAVAEAALAAFDGQRGITVGGGAVAGFQLGDTISGDLARAEMLAFPLLLLLSLLFFRGRATWLPLLVGVTTVLGTFLALTGIDAVHGLNVFALNLVIGLGLGLAIDYTLFVVTRFREELATRGEGPEAVAATMRTAGRTVVFSAATVACALITLTVFPQEFLRSMGIAGATVAVVAALATLAVAPPLLTLWGAKLARHDRGAARGEARWHRLAHAVMRRPGPVAAITAAAMLALASPALSTTWTPVDATAIPEGKSSREVADRLAAAGGERTREPVLLAVSAPASDGAQVRAFAAEVARVAGVEQVTPPRHLGGSTWQLDAVVPGDPAGAVARHVVEDVRDLSAPFDVRVGGSAAEFVDQQAALGSRLGLALGLLAGLTMLVLWLMTGSVVLPLKAVLMNVLTVGAALAPLTIIYQGGHLTGLLGYTPNGGVEPSDFLVTAALVFALSTDYGVFLLGRIKELRDAGVPDREAVAIGLARTGRVVTAAALLLAVAIGAFSTSSISFIQQIGVATAVGVLVDAFVVRTLLVPALMALLGRWNWWSPRPLARLHPRGLGDLHAGAG